jgi:hypothetical protein
MIRPSDAVISGSNLRRLDLDLVSANAELGGDRTAGRLGDFVGSGAIEFEPRQSGYLALLEDDFESWMTSPLDLASVLVKHFRAALAHQDLLSTARAKAVVCDRSSVRRLAVRRNHARTTSCGRPLDAAGRVND